MKLGAAKFAAAIEAWLAGFDLRAWPLEATHEYARVRAALERQGQPIGNMDLMIAAHALAEDSVIITNNLPRTAGDKSDHGEQAGAGLLVDSTADGKPIGIEITAPSQVDVAESNPVLVQLHAPAGTNEEIAPLRAA